MSPSRQQASQEALRRIRAARSTAAQTLDLIGLGLPALPAELARLTHLEVLYLSDNQLTALPAELGQLTNLRRLDLRLNQLTALPAELGQLTNLRWLYLSDNQLTALPAELGQLTNLRQLSLSDNPLTELLGLSGNQLTLVHVRGQMTPELVVDQTSTVEVLVAGVHLAGWPTDRDGQAPVAPNQSLLVEVAGRVNIEVTGEDRVEVTGRDPVEIPVPARDEPRLLLFEVRATHQGDGELWVIVRQGPLPLLTLVLRPSIRQQPPGASDAQLEAVGQTLVGPSPAPLTVLRVFEQRHGAAVIYQYDLDAPGVGFTRAYESRPIEQDRDAYVRGLFARIEQVWRDSDEDAAAFQEQLWAFGGQLLDELVPLELQRDLWNLRDRLAHIVVLSTEPFIPWELIHLKDPDTGQLPAETWFLAQLGLVRWLWQP